MGNLKSFICGLGLSVFGLALCESWDTQEENVIKSIGCKADKMAVPFSDKAGFSKNIIEFYKDPVAENGSICKLKQQGRVSVVLLTTTWCHNCPDVVKSMSICSKKFKNNKNIKFFNIIVGGDSIADIKKHFNRIGVFSFDTYHSLPLLSINGLDSVPTCIIYDKNGKQVFRFSGSAKYSDKGFIDFLKYLSA